MRKLDISKSLRKARLKADITQEAVAQALGIGMKSYQSYEEGRANPPLAVLIALQDLYNLATIDELLKLPKSKSEISDIDRRYYQASLEKRRIVDFILKS